MRLSRVPGIDPHVVAVLAERNIKCVDALLAAKGTRALHDLPLRNETLSTALNCVTEHLDAMNGPTSALSLLNSYLTSGPSIRTGLRTYACFSRGHVIFHIPRLDEYVLNGGLQKGDVLEVCGGPAVGKTQLCLQFVAKVLAEFPSDRKVLYLDSGSNLDPVRFRACMDATAPAGLSDAQFNLLSRRVEHVCVTSLPDLLRNLCHLGSNDYILVVVDALTSLCVMELLHGRENDERASAAILVEQCMTRLKVISYDNAVPVILTTTPVASRTKRVDVSGECVNPICESGITGASSTVVLEHSVSAIPSDAKSVLATLVSSNHQVGVGSQAEFEIGPTGLEEQEKSGVYAE